MERAAKRQQWYKVKFKSKTMKNPFEKAFIPENTLRCDSCKMNARKYRFGWRIRKKQNLFSEDLEKPVQRKCMGICDPVFQIL